MKCLLLCLCTIVATLTSGKAVAQTTADVCRIDAGYRSPEAVKIEAERREQRRLLLRLKSDLQALPPSPERTKFEQRVSEIEGRIREESADACPISRSSARSYIDEVFARIEECGSRVFPERDGVRLYGNAVATILFDESGILVSSSIKTSSGISELDRHVLDVIAASAPFGKVPVSLLAGNFHKVRIDANFGFEHQEHPSPTLQPMRRCSLKQ